MLQFSTESPSLMTSATFVLHNISVDNNNSIQHSGDQEKENRDGENHSKLSVSDPSLRIKYDKGARMEWVKDLFSPPPNGALAKAKVVFVKFSK